MLKKEECLRVVKSCRAKNGLEASDENLIATIHLMNEHNIDLNAALDQSSRSGNDHGIDAWYFDEVHRELFVYQSKLTESKALSLKGLSDLEYARQWVEGIVVEGIVESIPSDNHCLFNLYTRLAGVRDSLKKIHFVLLSLFTRNEIEDAPEFQEIENKLARSKLVAYIQNNLNGKLILTASEYNLEHSVPKGIKKYLIDKIPNTQIGLRGNAHLDLAYVSIYSLIELYRQRGNVLFDKNVRLSLETKEARERLVNPMEATFRLITSGKLSPNIFPFYHIGVTISASASINEDTNLLNLEAPSIINGCQTITIANEFLKCLEKRQDEEAIGFFKQVNHLPPKGGSFVVGCKPTKDPLPP